MVHNRVQYDLVAVLARLSLFTHIHAFWVAALILALIRIPDVNLPNLTKPLDSIAGSLQTMAAKPAAAKNGKADQASEERRSPKAHSKTA
jgi:hypothetical protein